VLFNDIEYIIRMGLNKQTSRHNYHAFLWHAVFLALAINFMDVDTIIPVMMLDAGCTSLQLGILIAIMLGGGNIAQLFFAPFLNNQSLKKGYLLGGINARIFALGGMSLLFYFSSHVNDNIIIWFIFILISLFSLSGAFANINYVDIFGKSILQEKRKSFFSIKQVISSILVFISAFFARSVLSKYDYPINYATLFVIAAILLAIASFGFWKIRELPTPNSKIDGFKNFAHIVTQEIRTNKNLRNYLFLINTQGISIVLMPFLTLYAKTVFDAGSHQIGNFLLLKVIGIVITGSIIFYYSKKVKYKYLLYIVSTLAVLTPLSILMLPGATLFPYIFLVGGVVFSIQSISISGILLEVTTNENRALYTGLTGAGSILPVIFSLLGGWIITEFGFALFFMLFILVILLSFFFIYRINCENEFGNRQNIS